MRPPEDCCSALRHPEVRGVLSDPDHPEHEELSKWLGNGVAPEAFSLAAIGRPLSKLKRRK